METKLTDINDVDELSQLTTTVAVFAVRQHHHRRDSILRQRFHQMLVRFRSCVVKRGSAVGDQAVNRLHQLLPIVVFTDGQILMNPGWLRMKVHQ